MTDLARGEPARERIERILVMGPMQHLLGSSHIGLDGHRAHVETNVWTLARFARDGQWKFARRRTILLSYDRA